VINGGQVGAITIPVNFTVGPAAGGPVNTVGKFSEIGVFRGINGTFIVDEDATNSFTPAGDRTELFGAPGDIPVAGDWDGTGLIRIGVFRPANGHWYLDMNNNGKWDGTGPGLDADIQFGGVTATCNPTTAAGLSACLDIPVVGDWNGNGVSKLGIFRGVVGQFYLDNVSPTAGGFTGSHNVFTTLTFGGNGDIPVANNWTGAGTCSTVPAQGPVVEPCDQIGVYRRVISTWFVNASGDGVFHPTDPQYIFGSPNDYPVVGNWNSTGSKRIGVFSSQAVWFVDINNDHVFSQPPDQMFTFFGAPGDIPVIGTWTLP